MTIISVVLTYLFGFSMWRFVGGRGVLASAWSLSGNSALRTRTFRGGQTFSLSSSESKDKPNSHVSLAVSASTTTPSHSDKKVTDDIDLSVLNGDLQWCNFGGLHFLNSENTSKFRVVFVLGGPGAGKGTQSALMEENYPIVHLSAGELLRAEVKKSESQHGDLIESCLVAGKIVPVEISLNLLRNAMAEAAEAKGKQLIYLVDGFPRNFDNLEGWARNMPDSTLLWDVLVYQCPLDVLEERILNRAKDSGRSDDNLDALKKRFKTFEGDTVPVLKTLERAAEDSNGRWHVTNISGDRDLETVWLSSQNALNKLISHDILSSNTALLEAIRTKNAEEYESLTDKSWYETENSETILERQGGDLSTVTNASVVVIDGRHVKVSYDIIVDGQKLRETRHWSHRQEGWQNVHFSRIPMD